MESTCRYKESPHSVFNVLEEPVTKDPGDGLGPMDLLDFMLWRRILDALRGDIKELVHCLKLLADHEVLKFRNKAWSSRTLRHAGFVAEAPAISDVLVLLGIASRVSDRSTKIRFADWVIIAVNDRRGNPDDHDSHIWDWHDRGSQEQSRMPTEFDL